MPVTKYIWDIENDSSHAETDETGAITALYENEPVQFGQLISQTRDGVTNHYHFDGHGSTRQLTDANQNVTDTYTYSAFGETVASSGATVNPFRFKGAIGYYTDLNCGNVYVRRRMYIPTLGRWLSRDSILFIDGFNPYTYVNNLPTTKIDPSGTIAITPLTKNSQQCEGAIVYWDFRLDYQAPCEGYLVQEINIYCDVQQCPCAQPQFPLRGIAPQLKFWEFWEVKINEIIPEERKWNTFTDKFGLGDPENDCGYLIITGELRFYCKDSTKVPPNTGDPVGTNEISYPPLEAEVCGMTRHSGGSPATSNPQDVAGFWASKPVEGTEVHGANRHWKCCDCAPIEDDGKWFPGPPKRPTP